MADKSFGIKELNLIGASGTPTITSPNNLNLNAGTVAISTDVTVGRHLDVDGHAELDNLNVSGVSTFSDTVNVGAGKSIRLYGASSGYSDIIAAAGSASTTFTLPANGGSSGQYLQTNGSGGLSWATVSANYATWNQATQQTFTTQSSHTWSGLSNVREAHVLLNRVNQATATGTWGFRLGTGGTLQTSNYINYGRFEYSAGDWTLLDNVSDDSFELAVVTTHNRDDVTGTAHFYNVSGNTWMIQFEAVMDLDTSTFFMVRNIGTVTLSGALSDISIFTSAGTWNSGSANLVYLTQP